MVAWRGFEDVNGYSPKESMSEGITNIERMAWVIERLCGVLCTSYAWTGVGLESHMVAHVSVGRHPSSLGMCDVRRRLGRCTILIKLFQSKHEGFFVSCVQGAKS